MRWTGRTRARLASAAAALLVAGGLTLPLTTPAAAVVAPLPCDGDVPAADHLVDAHEVPGVHRRAVVCVVFYGIALGIPVAPQATAFSPAAPVTRGAMASFVARALVAAGHALPAPSAEEFSDVQGSVHADAVHRLRAAGVVSGRSADRYAPGDVVTRDQTASLLLRAAAFARGVDVATLQRDDHPFSDLDGNVHAGAVGGAVVLGLLQGTTSTTYSPRAATTRAQMASVLARFLDREAEATTYCGNEADGYSLFHPADWHDVSGNGRPDCSAFHPEPVELPPGTETTDVAVLLSLEDVTFGEARAADSAEVVREDVLLVDGERAVRQERRASGDGLLVAGQRYTLWLVERGAQTLTALTAESAEHDYAASQAVLTRMVLSLDLVGAPLPVPPGTVSDHPPGAGAVGLVAVRVGAHDGYDRVVLEFSGDGTPGWYVAYDDTPAHHGSGDPVDVAGTTALLVSARGVGAPHDTGVPYYDGPERLAGPGAVVEEVVVGGLFEGDHEVFVGTDGRVPFRVQRLESPTRLVVDLLHP